jgi:hypothetical protein
VHVATDHFPDFQLRHPGLCQFHNQKVA